MKKLIKKQRNKIYKKSLIELINFREGDVLPWPARDCICHSIIRANYKKLKHIDDEFTNIWKELNLFNPCNGDSFWFNTKEERIIVLMFCIEMTK